MNTAEFLVVLFLALILYRLLRPLRLRLEALFARFLRANRKSTQKDTIDVTDYSKKEEK
jgi:hypothetical protein